MKLKFRAVFYRLDGWWMAHCLETDLIGRGKTREEALDMLGDMTASQVQFSISKGNLSNIFQPADPEFFQMFFAGKNCAVGTVEVEKLGPAKLDGVTLEPFETHEYHGQPAAVM